MNRCNHVSVHGGINGMNPDYSALKFILTHSQSLCLALLDLQWSPPHQSSPSPVSVPLKLCLEFIYSLSPLFPFLLFQGVCGSHSWLLASLTNCIITGEFIRDHVPPTTALGCRLYSSHSRKEHQHLFRGVEMKALPASVWNQLSQVVKTVANTNTSLSKHQRQQEDPRAISNTLKPVRVPSAPYRPGRHAPRSGRRWHRSHSRCIASGRWRASVHACLLSHEGWLSWWHLETEGQHDWLF